MIASLRSEPATFNRFAPNAGQAATDAVTRLAHATLVRVNRVTGDAEPWLAERWTTSPDGRILTFTLRDGVMFSDGVPFTSDDVVFTFRAAYDEKVGSSLADSLEAGGKMLQVRALDAHTVEIAFPTPFAPGVRLLDNLEAVGLIQRKEGETDRRAKTIHLTPRGRAIADKVETVSRRVRSDALAGLPEKDVETTIRVLQHICRVLEGDVEAAAA